ncbi:MAG: hypothetical protein NXH70_14755, partial [Hyphomonas sp.]|nr:hypothetical protein [Hyphomonas sp.]
ARSTPMMLTSPMDALSFTCAFNIASVAHCDAVWGERHPPHLQFKALILMKYFSIDVPYVSFQHCKRLTWRCRLARAASSPTPVSRCLLLPLDRAKIDDSTLRKSDAP